MPIVNRPQLNSNNEDEHCETIIKGQTKMIGILVLPEVMLPSH